METQRKYTWKEIEDEIGLSRSWIIKMERGGLLKIKAPKGTGRVARLFTHGEVVNMLRLSALRVAGFTPDQLRTYRELVMNFNGILSKYQKGLKKQWEHAPVLLFHIDDFFPDGFEAVNWDEVSTKDLRLIASYLDQAFMQGVRIRKLIDGYKRKTELALKSLDGAIDRLRSEFIVPVEDILFNKLGTQKGLKYNPMSGEFFEFKQSKK